MKCCGKDILQRVLLLLNLRHITQKEFFTKIGLHSQTPAHWKRGSSPSIEAVTAMATELNVSIDWLVRGEGVEDLSEESSPAHIVNRIEAILEKITKHKVYETNYNIFESIKDIVNQRELNDWRDGKRPLDTIKLCKIANRLGESVQYLMTGSNISKEEYTHYHGSKETDFMELYRQFHNLNLDDQEHIKSVINTFYYKQQQLASFGAN